MTFTERINRSNWKEIAFPWTVVLLSFFLPIVKYGIQIPIFLFIIAWLFYPKVSFKSVWWPFLVFGGYYIFHLIGMSFTAHFSNGLSDLMEKLSLLLFPFSFALAKPIPRRFRRLTLLAFAVGTVVSVLLSFISSAFQYAQTDDIRMFYMSNFSLFIHPSYVAMYINMAIAILLTTVTTCNGSKWQRFGVWLTILFLSLTLVFPTSKMGFITFALLIGFFLFKWATQRSVFSLNSVLLIFVGLCTFIFIRFDPVSQTRIKSAVRYAGDSENRADTSQTESNAARIYAWKTTLSEIKEHPLGVGTGDINLVLEDRFRETGLEELAEEGLNPHNQYLQSAMALGIPAVLWFLFSLLYPFGRIIRTKDWLYAFFICLVATNLTVESMLEKQSGIIFFAFFNAFLFFNPLDILNSEEKPSGLNSVDS